MKKRLTATLLSLCLLLTLLPAPIFAAGVADSGIPSAQSTLTQQTEAGGDTMAMPPDAQPKECTCEALCTEGEVNADCPVCSAEGTELDKVCVGEALMLPATAPAVTPRIAYDTLRIGNTSITDSGYWTTDGNGNLTASDADNYNVAFNADTNTLTLNNAIIVGSYDANNNPDGTGIYAYSSSGAVSLNIQVTGNNVVSSGGIGICAWSNWNEVSVTISGGGSLTASGIQHGINVQSNVSNAALTIEGTALKASGSYDNGVQVQAGESSSGSLSVNGGSLTASIYFQFGTGVSGSGIPSVTVAGNAVVDAKSGGIAHNSSTDLEVGADSSGGSGGIVFDGKNGTVYGDVTLQENLTIGEGESLTLDDGASLNTGDYTLTVNGGTLTGDVTGTVIYKVTSVSLNKDNLTLDVGGSETLIATITPDNASNKSINWESSNTGIATVDTNGNVTAVSVGSTTITATAADGSGKSATCSVTVNAVPTVITTQPSSVTVKEGETATFSVAATGSNLTYQWQQSTDGSNWTNIAGATSTAYTITNTTTDMNGYQYRCKVTGTSGEATSSTAILTVNAKTIVTTQPSNVTVTEGETTTFSVTATGSNLTYQWQQSTDQGSSWTNIAGATSTTYTITNTTTDMNDSWYRCVVTGDGGTAESNAATLTVNAYEPPYTGKYSYEIFVDKSTHGSIDVDRYATEGDRVLLSVVPEKGWLLDSLVATDKNGEDVALSEEGEGVLSFIMPSCDVTITATFVEDTTPFELPFKDVDESDWFYDPVCYVYSEGLMTGTADDLFEPNIATTRGMIVSILHRLEGGPAAENAGFSDIHEGDWYADAVNWAAAEGIASGYGDTFGANDPITREQLAAMFMNYAQYKGMDVSARANLDGYSDAENISSWATETMRWAVGEGLLSGVTDDTLAPQVNATRVQVAAILQRFLEA